MKLGRRLASSRFVVLSTLGLSPWLFTSPQAQAQDFVPGEVIVKFKNQRPSSPGSGMKAMSLNAMSATMNKLGRDRGLTMKASYRELGVSHFAKPGQDVDLTIRQLEQDPSVEYAEPNYILHKSEIDQYSLGHEATEAEDQAYLQQLLSIDQMAAGPGSQSSGGGGVSAMTSFYLTSTDWFGANTSWTLLTAGLTNKPIVAVIDTGVKYLHPKLSNAIWSNTVEASGSAGVDDDGNGYVDDIRGWNFQEGNNNPDDCDGHGTHVAGIVRGMTQDLANGATLTSLIRIMPLRFLDCYGSGTTSAAISAIYYAVNNGAKILNNSWGGGGYSRSLNEAIAYSYSANTLFVAAAGNSGLNNDASPMYPATYDVPNIFSVAATRASGDDSLAGFSNYGASTVHAGAPGVSIYSTYTTWSSAYTQAWLNGTSMAAPMVAGLAALISRERPTMTGYQIKSIIMANVDLVGALSGYVASGGRINSFRAVQAGQAATLMSSVPSYSMTLSSQDRSAAAALAGSGAGSCGVVHKLDGRRPPRDFKNGGTKRDGVQNKDGGGQNGGGLATFLLMIPLLVAIYFRLKAGRLVKAQRRHERFVMKSSVRLMVQGREMLGQINTISEGGVGLSSEAMLHHGSVVTMQIQSPHGDEQIQVQGHVVWSEPGVSAGVQFSQVSDGLSATIRQWTQKLLKAG